MNQNRFINSNQSLLNQNFVIKIKSNQINHLKQIKTTTKIDQGKKNTYRHQCKRDEIFCRNKKGVRKRE